MDAIKVLTTRRSCRSYKQEQIKEEELQTILACGLNAPSGMNKQSSKIVVVQNQEEIKELSKLNAEIWGKELDPFYGAPTVCFIFVPKDEKNGIKDGSLVIGAMQAGAYALNIGSCWINRCKEMFELEKGKEYLYEILKKKDPEYAKITHCNNVKKVIRALEYYKETGKKLSEHNEEQRQKESPYNFAYFVLYHDREELYDRINRRVDLMMEDGLLFEVESLIKEGYTKNLVSMQGLGYKEFFDYFDGRMTLEDTIDKIKKDTRHFAKRQLTWFRREKEVIWLNKKEYEQEKDLLDSVLNIIEEKGIRNGTKR